MFSTYLNSATTERNDNKLLKGRLYDRRTDYLSTLTAATFLWRLEKSVRRIDGMTLTGKTYVLGQKPPLWPPQNPHGLAWDRT
jgi:hypothetical protein